MDDIYTIKISELKVDFIPWCGSLFDLVNDLCLFGFFILWNIMKTFFLYGGDYDIPIEKISYAVYVRVFLNNVNDF